METGQLIVVVDSEDNIIGKKLRSKITKNDNYRVSSLWVFDQDSRLLISQRPSWKKNDPNKWSESAVGTVEAGEDYKTNLIKEAKEELGLDLDINKLIFISKEYHQSQNGNLFGAMYATILKNKKPRLDIDKNEVSNTEWVSHQSLTKQLKEKPTKFVGSFDKFYSQVWKKIASLF